jgi:hypothetical protein
MNRKVLLLSASFNRAKDTGAELAAAATHGALLDDPNASAGAEQRAARWKMRSSYGDIGLRYREDETVAYIASCMPAIYAACHRVLREVRGPGQLVVVCNELNLFSFFAFLIWFVDFAGSAKVAGIRTSKGAGFWCRAKLSALVSMSYFTAVSESIFAQA